MTYNIRNVRGENIAKLLVIWILDINWFYDERPSGLPTSWFTKNNICFQFLLVAIVRKSKCILQFKKKCKEAKFTTKSMSRRGENKCENFGVMREISRTIDLLLIEENFNFPCLGLSTVLFN